MFKMAAPTKDVRYECMQSSRDLNELIDFIIKNQYNLNETIKMNDLIQSIQDGCQATPFNQSKSNDQIVSVQLLALIRLQNVQLISHLRWILIAGHHFDHAQQQANGFYSFARLASKLQKHAFKHLERLVKKNRNPINGKHVQMLFEMSVLFDYQLSVLHRLAITYGQNHLFVAPNTPASGANNQNTPSSTSTSPCASKPSATSSTSCSTSSMASNTFASKDFQARSDLSSDGSIKQLFLQPMHMYIENNTFTADPKAQMALSLIFGPHGPFWYHSSTKKLFYILRAMFVLGGARSLSAKSLTPRKSGQKMAFQSANASLCYVKNTFRFTDLRAYNRLYFSLLTLPIHNRYVAQTVHLHVTSKVIVPEAAQLPIRLAPKSMPTRKIRCRLLKGSSPSAGNTKDDQRTLVFHCHGGGFVITSPDAHEIYLRDWASKWRSASILSVDYTRCQQFPAALQDVLDAYLHITGFSVSTDHNNNGHTASVDGHQDTRPDRVVLLGDSCGGNLIMGLLCLLNEIRHQHPQAHLLMPYAICAIYPVLDLRAVCSASRLLGSFDPILHNGNLLAMHGCYGGMQAELSSKICWFLPESKPEHDASVPNADEAIKSGSKVTMDQTICDRFWKVHRQLSGPFASPLTYPNLHQLADVQLHLIGSHICPLLDDSIQMYHQWKGQKSLFMFDDLPHGFIQFIDQCKQSRKATSQIGEIFAQVVSQPFSVIDSHKSQHATTDTSIKMIKAN